MYYWIGGSASNDDNIPDGLRLMGSSLEAPPFFDGESMLDTWEQPPLTSTNGKLFEVIGYPLGGIIFTISAVKKLKPYIEKEVEFLPISLPNFPELFMVNVLNVIDCLDTEKSKFSYYPPNTKSIHTVKHYVLNEKKLRNVMLFKIPQTKQIEILCTENFKRTVELLGVTGVGFVRLFGYEKR